MSNDDATFDRYERGLRSRGRTGWIVGGVGLAAALLLFGTWGRTLIRQQRAHAAPLGAGEQARLAPLIASGERHLTEGDDTVPAGLRDAIMNVSSAAMIGAPPCPDRIPGGARTFTAAELAAAPARSQPSGRREVFVLGDHTAPRLASRTEYHPGAVDGMAFLWDDATGAILCAGVVHAKSADRVDYVEHGVELAAWRAALDRDLVVALDAEVAAHLRQSR